MKLQNRIRHGLMCAGLAASLSFAQSTPAQTDQTQPASPQGTGTGKATDPASQVNTPGRRTDTTTTDSNRGRTSDSKTADHSGHTAGAAGKSTGDGTMVGKPDQMFMTKAAMGGMMEVQAAQMAQQKASSQEVKDYARKLEQDHTKANEKLKAIAKERQVELPTDIGPEHKAMMAKLTNLSGAEFDNAYMRMQVQHHRKDVKDFEKASTRSMDSDLKEFASSTLPTLKEHLSQAEQLNNSTRSRKQ